MPVEIDALKPTSILMAVSQSVNLTIGTFTSTSSTAAAVVVVVVVAVVIQKQTNKQTTINNIQCVLRYWYWYHHLETADFLSQPTTASYRQTCMSAVSVALQQLTRTYIDRGIQTDRQTERAVDRQLQRAGSSEY